MPKDMFSRIAKASQASAEHPAGSVFFQQISSPNPLCVWEGVCGAGVSRADA